MFRVLHVISALEVGGAEMMLCRLIANSKKSAFTHLIVSLRPTGGMRERFEREGVELIVFDLKKSPLSEFLRLISFIKNYKPSIVQCWLYHADLIGGVAARIAGFANVLWGIRTTDIRLGGSAKVALVRSICAKLSYFLPKLIICAAHTSKHAHVASGYDESKMVVVPNGYDFSFLTASLADRTNLRAECKFSDHHIVVGSLGRFNKVKDQKNFIRAAGILASKNENLRFLMVGRDIEWSNQKLVSWINNTGFGRNFVLLGEREDVPKCFSAMDIFCLHSVTEGFPNSLAEAMAMGLPCVSTDVGDASVLLKGVGVLVAPKDEIELARGIEGLLALNAAGRYSMGEEARRRIISTYSIEKSRDQFETIYNNLIKE